MRKAFALLTVAPALLAFPALAQTASAPAPAQLAPDGSANINLVGKVGLKGGAVDAAADGVTNPVGDTVDRVDSTVGKSVDAANLTLATREQVRAGAELYDTGGNSVGTVQSVEGDTAVVIRGGKLYNVPIAQIYHGAVGATHGLVTKLSSAEIQARTTAAIESR
ncbi:hypothetical protein ATE68_23440 [Sphingopyxis sp. H038]|uniref:hypothetical protein n=1 Tax=unclassified Sphingopyxis TaxID=2614943 RepID=UPI00072FF198|nr:MULTISPECIES: hypothetical protein [unclassified Sphingopyxis]KTD99398.1 hypothetical protein ATE78_23385 [Sphingopyxis sp. H012]KTE01016.1 hypothetical protein ATE76_24700 [Sphingopyxis sp. H093]KTE05386.1 hypothetical protein ATE70_23895 [Sphingopyxis sp. H053]KTE17197.1 hypothetical protein ATE75_24025 [Sphingopyxis sp. H080]KTE29517.1 hypothetical protein ATE68_23440 [Sphingopyxis sp. H038]